MNYARKVAIITDVTADASGSAHGPARRRFAVSALRLRPRLLSLVALGTN